MAIPAGAAATAVATASSAIMTRAQLGWAMGGWSFFIVENAILSENREFIIHYLSSQGYYALYGTASTAATVGILYGYRTLSLSNLSATTTTMLPRTMPPSLPRIGLAIVIQSIGLILAAQAIPSLQIPIGLTNDRQLQVRCPFDFARDRAQKENSGEAVVVGSMDRVSRHGSLWALGLTTLGAAVLQPSLPMTVWMTGPTWVALFGGAHADSRFRRGLGGTLDPEYERRTSHLPFFALIQQGTFYHWWTYDVKPLNAGLAVSVATAWALSRRRLPVASLAHIFSRK
jgi:hypothetical protein